MQFLLVQLFEFVKEYAKERRILPENILGRHL